ncbi:MAG: TonB-dependent receptor [Paludibacteraceae bacterium]|nr:TonB-dependent receptor [Paludibacteraceae bacterium]
MKKTIAVSLLALSMASSALAEKVEGFVYDKDNNEPMIGVTVSCKVNGQVKGTVTDIDGKYSLDIPEGSTSLNFSFMGYEAQNVPIIVERQKGFKGNVYMAQVSTDLDAVVVSAGRYEQKLSDLTVSMNVLKAADITKNSPSDIKATLNNTSGVDVTDKQPSIRGGSGWTYGVGSRCLIMVDGMSILSPAGGEINWNAVPMENIAQVEVMKGASSVLYGSSALNGLINVRTSRPSIDPTTRINMYMSIYNSPKNEDYVWYDKRFWKEGAYHVEPFLRKTLFSGIRNPMSDGIDISHERRIGNVDVTAAVNLFTDEGYKKGGYNKRVRAAAGVTYYSPKIKGMNFGFNTNFLSTEAADAFLWRSDKAPYEQSPLANMARQTNEFYFDPQFTYHDYDRGMMHKLRGRFYTSASNINSEAIDKNISEILDNMGTNYEALAKDVQQIVTKVQAKNPNFAGLVDQSDFSAITDMYNILSEVYPDVKVNKITGLVAKMLIGGLTPENISDGVTAIKQIGNKYFPNASSADYVDLIAWAMAKGTLPTSLNAVIPIALNEVLNNGKQEQERLKDPDRVDDYYLDYQFSKEFGSQNTLTVGATYEHVYSLAETSGTHHSDNAALYVQYDDKFFDKLNLSVGGRFEYYRVDDAKKESETDIFGVKIPVKPVFRGGLNYQVAKGTFIRGSFGQGYRYPSITEKFVRKDIGGIGAYPNMDLKAESGYNVELGIKQGYKVGNVKGFVDMAAFYTEYKDMIEFRIGLFNNNAPYTYIDNLAQVLTILQNGDMLGIGAQFYNVNNARIYGAEVNFSGIWDITSKTNLMFNVGYVYTEPIDVDYKDINAVEAGYTDPLQMKQKSNTSKYLKYRQKHSLKGSLDLTYDRYSIGTSMTWKSKTLAVDYFMVDERDKENPDVMDYVRSMLFGDLQGYWERNNKGYFVQDLRASVQITKGVKVMGIISNLWNKEYSTRPMDISQPRTYTLQLEAKF